MHQIKIMQSEIDRISVFVFSFNDLCSHFGKHMEEFVFVARNEQVISNRSLLYEGVMASLYCPKK